MGLLLLASVAGGAGSLPKEPQSFGAEPGVADTAASSIPNFTTPIVPAKAVYTLTLTGYNAVPAQTDSTPFVTASGAYTNPEVVAARSQDLGKELPFGTIIAIQGPASDTSACGFQTVDGGIGYRVIADTMNVRYTDRIDVLFSTGDNYLMPSGSAQNAASLLGVCPGVKVSVVGFVDISNPANLPKSQADLAAIVSSESNLALTK